MSFQGPWLTHLDSLAQRLEDHKAAQEEHVEQREDERFYGILREVCDVVRDAEKDATPELPDVVEKAHALLGDAVDWAYTSDHYGFLNSFADCKDAPLVQDIGDACGADITELFVEFYTKYLHPGAPRPKLPPFSRVAPWTKAPPPPHPYTTRLSRFRQDAVPPLTDKTPLAQLIYQARAELNMHYIGSTYGMELSSGGSILAMAAAGGWKRRDPILRYHVFGSNDGDGDDEDDNHDDDDNDDDDDIDLDFRSMDPGLSNVAHYITSDEERKLLFLADNDRIKSFSWAPDEKGVVPRRLPNVHTMNTLREFYGPLLLLQNGRIARAGKGKAAVWTLDALEKHQDSPGKLIGEGQLNTDNSWREADCPDIEMSSGTKPHSIVAFADDPAYEPGVVHLHAPTGHVLCGEGPASQSSSKTYACVSVDVEHGGRRVARYLGLGGTLEKITTSPGDPNVFVTAGSEGFVRMYDVRRPLPVLMFQTDNGGEPCSDVIYMHPDGIPTLFTGAGQRRNSVKVWDVRGKTAVYELGTGNNIVAGMAWDARRNSLFVATEFSRTKRTGEHGDYRPARIPRWATWRAAEEAAKALKEGRVAPKEERAQASVPKESPQHTEDQNEHKAKDDDAEMTDVEDDAEDDEMDEERSDESGEERDEDASSEEEVEEEDIDEEYSKGKLWPTMCFHRENYFGYAYDAGEHTLMQWTFKPEPNVAELPATTERAW